MWGPTLSYVAPSTPPHVPSCHSGPFGLSPPSFQLRDLAFLGAEPPEPCVHEFFPGSTWPACVSNMALTVFSACLDFQSLLSPLVF